MMQNTFQGQEWRDGESMDGQWLRAALGGGGSLQGLWAHASGNVVAGDSVPTQATTINGSPSFTPETNFL